MRLPFEQDDDGEFGAPVVVRPGEAAALVAAFLRAQEQAVQVWQPLGDDEFGRQILTVTPTVSERGEPRVYVELTPEGLEALLRVLARGAPPGVTWAWSPAA